MKVFTYSILLIVLISSSCSTNSGKDRLEKLFNEVIEEIDDEKMNRFKSSKIDSSGSNFKIIAPELSVIYDKSFERAKLNSFLIDSVVGDDSLWRLAYLKVAFHSYVNNEDFLKKDLGLDMGKLYYYKKERVFKKKGD